MITHRTLLALAALALFPAGAVAHAFLDHASPGVGASVSAAPGELQLAFTQKVVVALSSVTIAMAGGGAVPAAKAIGDGSSSEVLRVRLTRTLSPGSYVVSWRVVSVDTHPTSGTYKFTVGP